jgi:hypothetical protein
MPTPIQATTQEAIDIEDVTNNLILLKDGSAAVVIQIQSINFDLLSEEEQDAIIYSYAGLLNSLTFPVQILIRSQKKDISAYIKLLETQEQRQLNPTLKSRITRYHEFIEKIVKERNVLDKKFYVIIPFFYTELGLSKSTLKNMSPFPQKNTALPYDKNYIIQKALTVLEPKRDHLLRQFSHLNLAARQLSTQELIRLFYTVYNPNAVEGIYALSASQYTSPLTQSVKAPPPIHPPQPLAVASPTPSSAQPAAIPINAPIAPFPKPTLPPRPTSASP